MSSGFSQIRLYQNTTSTIPVGVYTDVTSDFLSTADSSTIVEDELYDYDGCNKTVSGLSPGTQYRFWVECIDEAGNSSGIQPLGNITTASSGPDETWWDGANGNYFFEPNGADPNYIIGYRFPKTDAFDPPLSANVAAYSANSGLSWTPLASWGGWGLSTTSPHPKDTWANRRGAIEKIEATSGSTFQGYLPPP